MSLQFDINRLNLRELNNGTSILKLCFTEDTKEVELNIKLHDIEQNRINEFIRRNTSKEVSNVRIKQMSLLDGIPKFHSVN